MLPAACFHPASAMRDFTSRRATLNWQTGTVPDTAFHLIADVSSDSPGAIGSLLEELIDGAVTATPTGFMSMAGCEVRTPQAQPIPALGPSSRRASYSVARRVDGERGDEPIF